MALLGIHHVSVLVSNTGEALAFYRDILGLGLDPNRPELGFGGAWLEVGAQQVHLLELPNPDLIAGRPDHVGRDRHFAFTVDDLDDIIRRLEQAGVAYTSSRSGRRAVFCRDPDGNGIELIGS